MATEKKKENAILNRQERDVLTFIAAGYTASEIASHLGLTGRKVERHMSDLMTKYDLMDITSIVPHALQRGEIDLYEVLESRFKEPIAA